MTDASIQIEPARVQDVATVLELIRGLAEYEHQPDAVKATEADIREALFGEPPAAAAVLAWREGEVAGLALWFQNFSTWTGRPGLWLEDLFVRPEHRGKGVGRALLTYLARLAKSRGYARVEWSVLDWNEPARGFYRAHGALPEDDWTNFRLAGQAFEALASDES